MATVGQQAVYRLQTSRYVQGVVAKIVSGDTVQLVCFSDGSAWGDGDPASLGAKVFDSVALGTGVGEWQAGTLVADAINAATTNLSTYSYVDSSSAGRLASPGASSTVSLAASTPRQPSTTRPVNVMLTGSWSWNLTAIGTQTGSLSFQSDSSSTPSTAIYAPAWSRGISAGLSIGDTGTVPVCLSYIVPAGHYYQVVATGGATFSIREQVM